MVVKRRRKKMITIVEQGQARQLPAIAAPAPLSEPPAALAAPVQAAPMSGGATCGAVVLAPPMRPATHTGHVRQTDDAMTNAKASRYYSREMSVVASVAVTAILFLAWWTRGGDIGIYFGLEILGIAGVTLLSLVVNRRQGLRYSAAGIAHHELRSQERLARLHGDVQKYQIDSQERVALYAIDRHADLIEQRWRLEAGADDEADDEAAPKGRPVGWGRVIDA